MSAKVSFDTSLFNGFSQSGINFFHDLSRHNNREWFSDNRDRYVRFVSDPMKQLVQTISPMISELDSLVITSPHRVVSRIYRDTRFSADKSPYRPRVWFAFKRNVECWTAMPTYFFQFDEYEYMFGMGMYSAQATTMRNFRRMIDENPEQFRRIIEPIQRTRNLKLESDCYKRRIPSEHPAIIDKWYQSKSIAVLGNRKPDKILFSAKLVDFLIGNFILLKPLYDFLWNATVITTRN
ncbi:MAG: DUF2461 domain-containing protein [Planctomycetaceae bacterium]|jgi:uncharacterized protein (TIGR02453 family)|nr:DUF2461 domain-containing protein [Planctomycetaceae bacterium]